MSKLDLLGDCPICGMKPADQNRRSGACSQSCDTIAMRNAEADLVQRFRQLGVERVLKSSKGAAERAYRERIAYRAAMNGAL